MSIKASGLNAMVTHLASLCTHAALYTDDAGTTEVSGGSYARKAITWGSASNGVISLTNQPVFDIPTSTTVKSVGYVTSGTAGGGTQHVLVNATDEAYAGAGTYTVTAGSITLT